MLLRRTVQFHWRNEGYADFEDSLARLSRQRRKNIRQERRRVREAGVSFRWLEGAQIGARDWAFFHRCYAGTYAAQGNRPYLSLEFFERIGAAMPDNLLLVVAERAGAPIAAALDVIDGEALYGRYWGALEHVPLLHFEACYYQAIDFAIARGLATVEAGAQCTDEAGKAIALTAAEVNLCRQLISVIKKLLCFTAYATAGPNL